MKKDYLTKSAELVKNNVSEENPILIHQAHHKKDLPYHYHNIVQILFLVKGEAVLYLNEKKYIIKDYDFIYINKYDRHKLIPDLSKSIVYVLEFEPNFIGNSKKYNEIFNFFSSLTDESKIISVNTPNLSQVILNLKDMLFESQYKHEDYKLFLEIRLMDILLSIKRYFTIKEPLYNKKEEDEYNKNIIKNVLDYVENHYYEKLTLDIISQKAHLSKRQFTRIFKKITGITFVEYLNDIRIKKALQMLRSNNENEIIYVCFETGFNDLSYFYRIFKKYTGLTPKEYIKIHLKKRN